jgi:ATP-dependent Lon protease
VVRPLPQPEDGGTEVEALHRAVIELAARAIAIAQPQTPIDLSQLLAQARDPIQLVYLIASMLSLSLDKEQQLLEASSRVEALRLLHAHLTYEVQVLELRQKITSQA